MKPQPQTVAYGAVLSTEVCVILFDYGFNPSAWYLGIIPETVSISEML
jgi:hypothetical protein